VLGGYNHIYWQGCWSLPSEVQLLRERDDEMATDVFCKSQLKYHDIRNSNTHISLWFVYISSSCHDLTMHGDLRRQARKVHKKGHLTAIYLPGFAKMSHYFPIQIAKKICCEKVFICFSLKTQATVV